MDWQTYNHLYSFMSFSNEFFILRHGRSLANEKGIIVSSPAHGISGYGLSPEGVEQVRATMRSATAQGLFRTPCHIYSSPFLRAKETAEIAAQYLENCPVMYDERLRERFFGDFELTQHSHYQNVWDEDRHDPAHKRWGVESLLEVLDRTTALAKELERTYVGQLIILVTHGDPGQILETGFLHKNPTDHRQLEPFQTAELRKLSCCQN